jgi:hypothetical protein
MDDRLYCDAIVRPRLKSCVECRCDHGCRRRSGDDEIVNRKLQSVSRRRYRSTDALTIHLRLLLSASKKLDAGTGRLQPAARPPWYTFQAPQKSRLRLGIKVNEWEKVCADLTTHQIIRSSLDDHEVPQQVTSAVRLQHGLPDEGWTSRQCNGAGGVHERSKCFFHD